MEEKRKYLEYFDGVFDSTVSDKRQPEKWPYVAYSKTDGVVYTIIPEEEMWIVSVVRLKDISNCTYEMVDLGLSVKWADRNVGASSTEDDGAYFQWGDTNAYALEEAEITSEQLADILNPLIGPGVTKDNVKDKLSSLGITGNDISDAFVPAGIDGFSPDKEFNWDTYFDTTDRGNTFNKYNNDGGLTALESIDDAASVHMGSDYRMPTMDELSELRDNTTPTFIDLQGNEFSKEEAQNNAIPQGNLKGVRLTASNGNSIFLPTTGGCRNTIFAGIGTQSDYWSSSLGESNSENGGCLRFSRFGDLTEVYTIRYDSNPVRGVRA